MKFGKHFWQSIAMVVVIIGLTVAVYRPALRADFIWDDDDHLTTNPAMTASNGLQLIWSDMATSRYYPLTLTTFWVGHRLWGLNPVPFHAVNILLHAVNAVLLLALLRRLRVPGAWLAATLWAVHPVCIESVAWVTELKNVQSAFFFFSAVLAYLWFDEDPGFLRYALMFVCAIAAFLSKSSTVILPGVILMIVWWQRGTCRKTDWRLVAPLFAAAAGMAVLTILEQRFQISRATNPEVGLGIVTRVLLAGKSVWFYLGKALWPWNLMFLYPRWTANANWLPLAGLIGAGIILWRARQQSWGRAGLLAFGYFTLALLPVLGFFDLYFFRYSYVADHFQYLALVAPVALVTAGITTGIRWQSVRVTVAVVAVMALSSATWRYTHVFQNLEALWEDTVTKNPAAWLAHNNLGVILAEQGRHAEAANEYALALRLNPAFAEAHGNWGNLLARQGKMIEAEAEQLAAIRCDPDFAGAHYNLGNIRVLQGDLTAAITEYQTALRLQPNYEPAKINLATALKKRATADF